MLNPKPHRYTEVHGPCRGNYSYRHGSTRVSTGSVFEVLRRFLKSFVCLLFLMYGPHIEEADAQNTREKAQVRNSSLKLAN